MMQLFSLLTAEVVVWVGSSVYRSR